VNHLPDDRPLTDAEIAIAVARAILDDRQNPGASLPFQPHPESLLNRLGIADRTDDDRNHRQRFREANREPGLELRMAEYCWRLVGLGYLLPQMTSPWGAFHLTARGRVFLEGLDPIALTPGGLDERLGSLGFGQDSLARQYVRRAQDCFLAGHYESSIVMLGVANEALVLQLSDGLSRVRAQVMTNLKPRPSRPTARQDIVWITDALDGYRKPLQSALNSAGADASWIETLRDVLQGTSQAIRVTRNEHGHPTGFTATQEDALQLLVLFPRFAEACSKALTAIEAL